MLRDLSPPTDAKALDVVTLGETMALFMADDVGPLSSVEHWRKRTAGADSNVAVGLARLGLKVGWVSRLGVDSLGDYVLHALAAEGIDVSRVQRDPTRPTGFMLKSRSDDGSDPVIEYFRRGSAASALGVADYDAPYFDSARHLHVTGVMPGVSASASALVEHAMQQVRATRARGRTLSFDPNLRRSLWPSEAAMCSRLNALAALADWVLPGLDEGRLLSGAQELADVARHFHQLGATTVVIKLGADGAWVSDTQTGTTHVPGVPVPRVVDTVGAGDGFAAGVISARLEGLPWPQAVARGNWVGAQVVQQRGDVDGLPRRSDLR
jgi:sugar/nucleoside kinase (ribokinase family)